MRIQVQLKLDINEIKIIKFLAKYFDLSISSYIRRCWFHEEFFHIDLSNSKNSDFYFCNARNNLNVIESLIEDMYRDYISNEHLNFYPEQKQKLMDYYQSTKDAVDKIEEFFSAIDDKVTKCYLQFYERIEQYLKKDQHKINYVLKNYEAIEIEKEGYSECMNIRLTELEKDLLTSICAAQKLPKNEYTKRKCIFKKYPTNGVFIEQRIKDNFNEIGKIINSLSIRCHKFYNDYYLGTDFILYEENDEVLFMYKEIKRVLEDVVIQIKNRFSKINLNTEIFYYERDCRLDLNKILKEENV